MKKVIASIMFAVMTVAMVPAVSAATVPNPWQDSSIHVMEIEGFDSGYPSGDVSKFPGFWSYNQEINFAPVCGQIKNSQLVINGCGTDSFFFNRAKGTIGSALLQQAQGIGFYIKNGTKSAFSTAFYGIGDKEKMSSGAAMFMYNAGNATFIDMTGKATTFSGAGNMINIPKGTEGYLLFDFSNFVDGWHGSTKLNLSKTDLKSIGIRLNDAVVNVRYTVSVDHFFLYGKNIKHVPGTISLKSGSTSTTSNVSSKASTPSATTSSKKAQTSNTTVSQSEGTISENLASTASVDEVSSDIAISSVESTEIASSEAESTAPVSNSSKKMSPLVPILIIAIILVAAVAAIVIVSMIKKKKVGSNQ